MVLVLRLGVGAVALLFLVMGAGFVTDPAGGAASLGLTPEGVHGLNTLRGDIAGLFVGSALMLVLGLVRREPIWLLAVAVLMAVIALGRLVGFVVDGAPAQPTLVALGVEIFVTALLLVAANKLPGSERLH
ncbi:MAG TPA: DUF4345 family protein [Pseudomonadales bacterium]